MNAKEQFTQRLVQAVLAAGLTWNGLAEKLSEEGTRVYAGTTTPWRDGAIPSGELMLRLPKALGVNGHWLLTGEGPMHPTPAGDAETQLQRIRELLEMPAAKFEPAPRPGGKNAHHG